MSLGFKDNISCEVIGGFLTDKELLRATRNSSLVSRSLLPYRCWLLGAKDFCCTGRREDFGQVCRCYLHAKTKSSRLPQFRGVSKVVLPTLPLTK